jgi:hypothetical protein
MGLPRLERTKSLRAHPNIKTAARIIGVSPSTISRRADLTTEGRGERDKVLSPTTVMELAVRYRKRSLNEVAIELITYAREQAPEESERIEEEIDTFVAELGSPPHRDNEAFLAMAKEYLPRELFAEVESTLKAGSGKRPRPIRGYVPD